MTALVALPGPFQTLKNVEAEAAFLGAVLIDNSILSRSECHLTPDQFFEPLHGQIFSRILELSAGGSTVTPVTLKPHFQSDEALENLGGVKYIARLTADGQGLIAPQALAKQIAELAARRVRLEWHEAEKVACYDLDTPLGEIEPPQVATAGRLRPLDLAALARIQPTPKKFIIPSIAPAGEVTLFTGAGAVGKSLLAQQFATAIAAGVSTLGLDLRQAPAVYLTCEDDTEQLHFRQVHICKEIGRDGLAPLKWRGVASFDGPLFELGRAEEVECRVSADGIVEAVDVAGNGLLGFGSGGEGRSPDKLGFQRLEERLDHRVVVAVSFPGHRDADAMVA